MVENRPLLTFLTHLFLICGFLVVALLSTWPSSLPPMMYRRS